MKDRLPALLLSFALLAAPVSASAFSVNNLLSDGALTEATAMTLGDIHKFLMRRGVLAFKYVPDTDGIVKTPAEIISRVALTWTISPKFLLALLQREQSLIEDPSPSQGQFDWATGFAVCDSCSTDDPDVAAWRGFANQVEGAARQIRNRYLPDLASKGTTVSGIGPGVTRVIDGVTVTPANDATAVLYTYTPHLQGNLNFAKIWQRWFSLSYPDGTVVKSALAPDVWLIQNGEKRRFASRSSFLTRFRDADVVTAPDVDIARYPEGPEIRFANYSLLSAPERGIFLIDGEMKRHIESPEVFRTLGFNPEEVQEVTSADLDLYDDGLPVTLASSFPQGALMQDRITGGVYWIQDGNKHPIWGKEVMDARFGKKTILPATQTQLARFPDGEPVRFRDGTLVGVRGKSTVYVIEHGARRPIVSESVFLRFGWKWQNVIWTSDAVANLHAPGDPMDIESSDVAAAAAGT